jgi:N-acyl-D-aspartate/D-glutamate deacylase
VTVFDPATVKDEATFADPHRYPTGIPYVVVNGALVVDRGTFNAAGTARLLPGRRSIGTLTTGRPRRS